MTNEKPNEDAATRTAREWLTAKSCEAGHIYSAMPPEGSERAYFDDLLGGGVLTSLAVLIRAQRVEGRREGLEKAAQIADQLGRLHPASAAAGLIRLEAMRPPLPKATE